MNEIEETEISPIGLFFSIAALIFFTLCAYKITGSVITTLIVGPSVAVSALRPSGTKTGNQHFLWERDKKPTKRTKED